MKKTISILFTFVLILYRSYAQDISDISGCSMHAEGAYDFMTSFVAAKDSTLADRSYFNVLYKAGHPVNNKKDKAFGIARLTVGNKFSFFTNETSVWKARRRMKQDFGDYVPLLYGVSLDGTASPFYHVIRFDKKNNKVRTVSPVLWQADMLQPFVALAYEEETPGIAWNLSSGDSVILGYNCRKAECEFRGRCWTVWYTEDVPIKEGPWKLHGAPGLILYAVDSDGCFSFEALKIETVPVEMYDYRFHHEKKITYGKYKKYEKECFQRPMSFFPDKWIVLIKGEQGTRQADDAWSIDYQPMEFDE